MTPVVTCWGQPSYTFHRCNCGMMMPTFSRGHSVTPHTDIFVRARISLVDKALRRWRRAVKRRSVGVSKIHPAHPASARPERAGRSRNYLFPSSSAPSPWDLPGKPSASLMLISMGYLRRFKRAELLTWSGRMAISTRGWPNAKLSYRGETS